MKIERINENQIRCTLTSLDLSSRNLNLGELAYGSEKARGLFREMIQKASNEVGFDAEDIPLMVEAIPLSGESVMLVITKIEDPEELDTRFSKFSPLSEDGAENLWGGLANELLEGADGLMELFKQNMLAANAPATSSLLRHSRTADPQDFHGRRFRQTVFPPFRPVFIASAAWTRFPMPQMLYRLWALSRASSIKSREPASIIWFFPASLLIRSLSAVSATCLQNMVKKSELMSQAKPTIRSTMKSSLEQTHCRNWR